MICSNFFVPVLWLLATNFLPVYSVDLTDLFPFSESDGSTKFSFGDDGQTLVGLTSSFALFGQSNQYVQISGNGVVGMGPTQIQGAATNCQPTGSGHPKIMAFWSDANMNLDSRAGLYYLQTSRAALLDQAKVDIIKGFPALRRTLNLSWMLIITWKDLPRHGSSDSYRNTFQLVLVKSGTMSFVLFYYVKLEWSSDASWAAGFDFGDARSFYKLPGSCSVNSFQPLPKTGNLGANEPGKWVFKVDRSVEEPSLSSQSSKKSSDMPSFTFQPKIVSVMGSMPLVIEGISLEEQVNVTCAFQDSGKMKPTETSGIIIEDKNSIICPLPFFNSLGKLQVNLLVSYDSNVPSIYKGHIYVIKEHEVSSLLSIWLNRTLENSLLLSAQWNPLHITMNNIKTLDNATRNGSSCNLETIEIVILEYNGKVWKELVPITPPILNNGVHMSPLNMTTLRSLTKPLPRTFALKSKYTLKTGQTIVKLLPSSILTGTDMITTALYDLNAEVKNGTGNIFDRTCKTWYDKDKSPIDDVLPCPKSVDQARSDLRFMIDGTPHLEMFLNASSVYIQSVPSAFGGGSQCTYDSEGRLLVGTVGASHLHRYNPNNWKDYWSHLWKDKMPFLYCCKWSVNKLFNCNSYYFKRRQINYGKEYVPPKPARVTGFSHITTFDGLNYSFSGGGEFWMINYLEDNDIPVPVHDHAKEFKMQVRLEPVIFQPLVMLGPLKWITAAVMEDSSNGKQVKVQAEKTKQGISLMIDGEYLFSNGSSRANDIEGYNVYHEGVTISVKSKDKIVISFYSGYSIALFGADNGKTLNIVVTANADLMIGGVKGLLGDFNGDVDDDFKFPNGTIYLPDINKQVAHDGLSRNFFDVQWLVHKNDSIFSYAEGDSYEKFYIYSAIPQVYFNLSLSNGSSNYCILIDEESRTECNYDNAIAIQVDTIDRKNLIESAELALDLFREARKATYTLVNMCEVPQLSNAHFFLKTITVGSNLKVFCDTGFKWSLGINGVGGEDFTCSYNPSNEDTPTWTNANSNKLLSSLSCRQDIKPTTSTIRPKKTTKSPTTATTTRLTSTKATTKIFTETLVKVESTAEIVITTGNPTDFNFDSSPNTFITKATHPTTPRDPTTTITKPFTEDGIEGITQIPEKAYSSTPNESSGLPGIEVFIIVICCLIGVIILIVIVADYPACKKVRSYVVNRVRPNRSNDPSEFDFSL